MEPDTDYETLEARLAEAGVVTSLAELHGGLCGTLCVGGISAAGHWLEECLHDWQLAESGEVGEALRGLELETWQKLKSMDLSFEPLLPGEDQPLDLQVRGLALWCHGFLVGLGFGGYRTNGAAAHASAAVEEITKDFSELSRAVLGDEPEDSDEAGFELAELKEYVRVGVQLVFEEYGTRELEGGSDRIH
jgi:uncharacterized protein YgfB (UPF0149 family)